MKKSISVGLPTGAILVFALLWIATGDLVGALLSLVVLALVLTLLVAIAGYLVSNAPTWWRRVRGVKWSDHLLQLEAAGQAAREHYKVSRALSFEDQTCGYLMHLVDIGENRVLCLYGQHYYEFEPIEDDPEVNQPRTFPTTDFSLLRDTKRNKVLAIFPGSTVLEPVICQPISAQRELSDLGVKFKDGAVVTGATLDAAERLLRARN